MIKFLTKFAAKVIDPVKETLRRRELKKLGFTSRKIRSSNCSADYPLGGMLEPYDIERDKGLI